MKKHDEGYTLVLVVVIILVLGIMSAALMSLTVTNLRNQRNSVNRMQEKYSAQGAVEIAVAELEAQIAEKREEIEEKSFDVPHRNDATENDYPLDAVTQWIEEMELTDDVDPSSVKVDGETFSFEIPKTVKSETGKTQVDFVLKVIGNVKEEDSSADTDLPTEPDPETETPGDTGTDFVRIYEITFGEMKYASYDVMDIEGGAE